MTDYDPDFERIDGLLEQFVRAERGEDVKPELGPVEKELLQKYHVRLNQRLKDHEAEASQLEAACQHLSVMQVLYEAENHYIRMIDGEKRYWPVLTNWPVQGRGPMLKAHEILEQLNSPIAKNTFALSSKEFDALTPVILQRKGANLAKAIMAAQKFDVRAVLQEDVEANAQFADDLSAEELFHLPFPICWYEWEIRPAIVIGCLLIETPVGITQSIFGRIAGAGWATWDEIIGPHAVEMAKAASVLITSRCTERHNLAAPEKLNVRRLHKNKPPLFSHTVVEVRGVVVNSNTGMVVGERRSPRMHWRRGHIRHYRNDGGDVIYRKAIAPMLIGRQDIGVIEHSYKVESGLAVSRISAEGK